MNKYHIKERTVKKMQIASFEKITVVNGYEKMIQFNKNGQGDRVTAELFIQTLDDIPFTVVGYLDVEEDGFDMVPINVGTYETGEVTEAGNYMVATEGLQAVKLTFTGAGDVLIKGVR